MTDRLEIIEEWGIEGTLEEKDLVAMERRKGSIFFSQDLPPQFFNPPLPEPKERWKN